MADGGWRAEGERMDGGRLGERRRSTDSGWQAGEWRPAGGQTVDIGRMAALTEDGAIMENI